MFFLYCSKIMLSDAFARLRNATISFVITARLSAFNTSSTTRRIFMKFNI